MAMDYSARPEVREAALRIELENQINSPERPAKKRRIRDLRAALREFGDEHAEDTTETDDDSDGTAGDDDKGEDDDSGEAKAPTKRAPAKKAA